VVGPLIISVVRFHAIPTSLIYTHQRDTDPDTVHLLLFLVPSAVKVPRVKS